MHVGDRNKRVYFQRSLRTSDGGGGWAVQWQPVTVAWGQLRLERGRERLAAGRLESAVAGILTVPYSEEAAAVDADYRAVIDGVPYQIRSVTNPDQRRKFLEMIVEEGVAT